MIATAITSMAAIPAKPWRCARLHAICCGSCGPMSDPSRLSHVVSRLEVYPYQTYVCDNGMP